MAQRSVLCKFFMHGACLKGESCEFSHSWADQANNVCTFYQRGICSYGSRCRYDHIKLARPQTQYTSPIESSLQPTTGMNYLGDIQQGFVVGSTGASETTTFIKNSVAPLSNPWQINATACTSSAQASWGEKSKAMDSADPPICAYAAAGFCPYGDTCPQIHGDLCQTCGKYCLHPSRPVEREEHKVQCECNKKRLEALRMSQEIECSVCLERVLSKPTVSERKFGLLSGCDHPFCISCIRDWRNGPHPIGMDLDTVIRACPVCRVGSHYVIPSIVWYSTPEEKEEIVKGYKHKLSEIDCKHFDFGNGSCPFGSSCFYKHAFKDGSREEIKLRHIGAADGSTVIAKNIRLADFLGRLDLNN
ncbi:hypothetical protein O6H91_01G146100 [Diphasiastrum complanatum]|uniref:Uncharacterized protein n=2 Tax=Diphasiastrum complanatum TaxID=34168 RepID=A0ACC2EWZ3_DIPCM|nr:hypothetical protein O6H91_01G146100 [Diphasiastrum complanatum]KAJ7571033.1 hypothetical protein O6H91_01G146100 [Diphasiastrum complanatum]